jgi:hypothetical protein
MIKDLAVLSLLLVSLPLNPNHNFSSLYLIQKISISKFIQKTFCNFAIMRTGKMFRKYYFCRIYVKNEIYLCLQLSILRANAALV